MSAESPRYAAEDVQRFLTDAFVALGVPERDAGTVARLMVKADLHGHDTHGTFRLQQYSRRLRDGGTNPRPNISIAVERDATAIVDYFAPLKRWLDEQNEGRTCGW